MILEKTLPIIFFIKTENTREKSLYRNLSIQAIKILYDPEEVESFPNLTIFPVCHRIPLLHYYQVRHQHLHCCMLNILLDR